MFGLNVLPIPASDIITYMNLAFIGMIVIGAIIGFFRGTMKSIYFAIATLVIFIGGWLLMGPISKGLINSDLGWTHVIYNGIELHKPLDFVHDIILESYPEYAYLLEDTYSLDVIKGVIDIVFKIIYVFSLILISFTIYYLITGIIWIFVKKPFKKKFGKKKVTKSGKEKYKVGIGSRFGGLGIGAVKGLMYTLLIGFIFAGLASIATDIQEITAPENAEAVVVINEDTFTVVEVANGTEEPTPTPETGSIFDEYADVLEVITGYRKTITGKVFGSIKYGKNKTAFDEYVFDTIFSIDTGKTNVKLRNELRTVARALSNKAVKQIMQDGFDITKLKDLPAEDLKQLIDTLSSLKIINVVIPVGIEFITYTSALKDVVGPESFDSVQQLLKDNLQEFLDSDYCEDVKSLGYVFVDVLDLVGDNLDDLSKVDYFAFDQATVDDIFTKLSSMGLYKIVAPVAVNYLLNTQVVADAITNAGYTLEDLGLTNLDTNVYQDELKNISKIYEKVCELGLKIVEGNLDISGIDPEKVKGLTDSLFSSVIITKAMPVLAINLKEYVPENYKPIFVDEELKNLDYRNEFEPLLTAVASLVQSGILDSQDPIATLKGMEDKKFEDLGKYLSKSTFITSHLNQLTDIIFKQEIKLEIELQGLTGEEKWDEHEIVSLFKAVKVILNSDIITSTDPMETIKTLDVDTLALGLSGSRYITKNLNAIIQYMTNSLNIKDLTFVGLDESQGEFWDYAELKGLFGAFKTIIETDLITSTDPIQTFKNITDGQIDSLSIDLGKSKFFTKNLDVVISYAIKSLDPSLQLESLDKSQGEVWDDTQIKAVLHSVKTIVDTGVLESPNPIDVVKTLSDAQIETLSTNLASSIFMTKNLSKVLTMFTGDMGFEFATLSKEDWNTNEIYSILTSVTIIAKSTTGNQIQIETLLNLNDTEISTLLESKLLTGTLKNILVEKSQPGQELEILKGVYADGSTPNGEKVYVWTDTKGLASSTVTDAGILNITPVTHAIKYIIYKNDHIFATSNSTLVIDLNTIEGYTYSNTDKFTVKAITEEGELRKAFNAITCLGLTDINNVNIDLRNVIKEKATLLSSYILTETLIDQIRNQDNDKGGMLEVSGEYLTGDTKIWRGENGELNNIINALDLALGISSSTTPVLITDINIENISLPTIISGKDTILKSNILSDTMIVQIQGLDGSVFKLANEYKTTDYTVWKNNGTNEGELSILFGVIDKVVDLPATGFTIDENSIEISRIVDNRDEILKSAVITTTVVDKISTLKDLIFVPTEFNVPVDSSYETDYNLWKNTYNNGTLDKRGELDHLLNSLGIALGLDGIKKVPITGITENSISLKNIIDQSETVFNSEILTATVVGNIQKLGEGSTKVINIPSEFTSDYKVWRKDNTNEINNLLNALSSVVPLPETGFNIDTTQINISKIYSSKDEILKSAVLTATIIEQINKLDTIIIVPNELKIPTTNSWDTDYALWKNTYENGKVKTSGELDKILVAFNYALDLTNNPNIDINNITEKSIKLANIIDNSDEVFKSEVLTATVVDNIQKLGESNTIKIPTEFNGDYKVWNSNNTNEITHLLKALNSVVNLPADGGFNIDTTNINLKQIIGNKNEILKSAVLTATIIDQIMKLNNTTTPVITIPQEFEVTGNSWNTDYDLWKNTYDGETFVSGGELDKLLEALYIALDIEHTNPNINAIDPNTIKLQTIIDRSDEVFNSEILTATVVTKIQDLQKSNVVVIPSEYRTDYKVWNSKNTNELNLLLKALSNVVVLPESGFNIDTDTINLKNIFNKQDEILKSAVLSATIIDKIMGLNTVLNIPEAYKIPATQSWENDYNLWKNTYIGTSIKKGELSNILGAINLVAGPDTTINNFSNLQFDAIFDTNVNASGIVPQDEILKSRVISETIIQKLVSNNGSGTVAVSIPDMNNLNNPLDRSGWYNTYNDKGELTSRHELANLINALKELIGAKTDLTGINIFDSLDKMLENFQNDEYKNKILKSIVVSDTIRVNLTSLPSIQNGNYIEKVFNKNFGVGYDVNDLSKWYGIDETTGNPKHLELWHFLNGASLILYSPEQKISFKDLSNFTIDNLLGNSNLIPVVDPITLQVTSSNIDVMLNSIIIEGIFAELSNNLYNSTLNFVINEPVGGFKWFRIDAKAANTEYDLRTFLESYYIIQKHINFANITESITTLISLGDGMHDKELGDLATGMVISRTFRGSIEKLFNKIFNYDGAYETLYNNGGKLTGMKAWNEVKFIQSDYDEPTTKKQAHDKFIVSYKAICTELAKFSI